jgi:hypothetical protein
MTQSQKVRALAAKGAPVETISARLGLRPAAVRRVLDRSPTRGAPRKRETSATLSFTTSQDVATRVREAAEARDVTVSAVLEGIVVSGLPRLLQKGQPVVSRRPPRTAADAPQTVRRLLKSYAPKALRWSIPGHRHEIVVAILTRGGDEAKQWLWQVLSREDARELVRAHRGAGCAEPARTVLRRELGLTEADIPQRSYLGMGSGAETA